MSSIEEQSSYRTPQVTTGFQVRYVGPDDAFTTHQTFQPTDGTFYKVESFKPVVFLPAKTHRIDTSTAEAPKVVAKDDASPALQLNEAIRLGLVTVADRWSNPVEIPA